MLYLFVKDHARLTIALGESESSPELSVYLTFPVKIVYLEISHCIMSVVDKAVLSGDTE